MELREAEERSRRVMVDVQKLEWLLLEDEEDGVDELPVLEIVVDNIERLEALGSGGGGRGSA